MHAVVELLAAATIAVAAAALSWFGMAMEAPTEHPAAVELIRKTPVSAQSTVSQPAETPVPC